MCVCVCVECKCRQGYDGANFCSCQQPPNDLVLSLRESPFECKKVLALGCFPKVIPLPRSPPCPTSLPKPGASPSGLGRLSRSHCPVSTGPSPGPCPRPQEETVYLEFLVQRRLPLPSPFSSLPARGSPIPSLWKTGFRLRTALAQAALERGPLLHYGR